MTKTKKIWEKVSDMNLPFHITLGPINSESLIHDTKHLAFTLSRYKFAAKIMRDCKHIVEIGCGEGIGTLTFLRETKAYITAIDFDSKQIKYVKRYITPYTQGRINFILHDIISKPYNGKKADGLVCLDVIEHLHPAEEILFFKNCLASLSKNSIAIFGTPNKYSEEHSSQRSKKGHINLFDPQRLISSLKKYFSHTFLFSMNDEIVHTGYNKMAHYLIALNIK